MNALQVMDACIKQTEQTRDLPVYSVERTHPWAFLVAQSCATPSFCCCQGQRVGLIQQQAKKR